MRFIAEETLAFMEAGWLCQSPPIISRIFDSISCGNLDYCQALKVEVMQVPFMFAQFSVLLVSLTLILFPVGIYYFTGAPLNCEVNASEPLRRLWSRKR